MVSEVVALLDVKPGGTYVDATVGPGGHSEQLLMHMGAPDTGGLLICLDRDAEALAAAQGRLQDPRCKFLKTRFSDMVGVLGSIGINKVDGVLMDFGISMLQMKNRERGFSFDSLEVLDMRMDQDEALTAREIVNYWPEKEIARVIYEYAEEFRSRRIASAIVSARRTNKIETCKELADIVYRAIGKKGRTHPATRTFQGLRIAVNEELQEIADGLQAAKDVLSPGGRMALISYHSLEDRIVKNFIRDAAREGEMKILTKKPLTATRQETLGNPAARSAKVRGGEVL